MDTLEYQKRLADFDEEIQRHKLAAQELEYKRAMFIAKVLGATLDKQKSSTIPGEISVTKQGS